MANLSAESIKQPLVQSNLEDPVHDRAPLERPALPSSDSRTFLHIGSTEDLRHPMIEALVTNFPRAAEWYRNAESYGGRVAPWEARRLARENERVEDVSFGARTISTLATECLQRGFTLQAVAPRCLVGASESKLLRGGAAAWKLDVWFWIGTHAEYDQLLKRL